MFEQLLWILGPPFGLWLGWQIAEFFREPK